MTVYAITDTKKGRTGIAPTFFKLPTFHCRLKAYCIDFLGRKNPSFRNSLSPAKRSRSWPNSVYVDMSIVKGWQRSDNFGRDRPILAKMGAGTSPAERDFFVR